MRTENKTGEVFNPATEETLANNYKLRIDDGATYIYVGKAEMGSATSSAVWQIKRLTVASGDTDWADSNSNFENIWDNRVSLTYN